MKTIGSLTLISWLAAAITLVAAAVDTSKLPPASNQKGLTYAKDIKPIFDKSCVRCHGAEKPKAGLRLDGLEGALKGTQQHKVIKTGDSAQSSLVHSV
ncbi:MAG TPA: c-type cytochrome domain-containing protein, partial [Verrucomicrobiae bacterium]